MIITTTPRGSSRYHHVYSQWLEDPLGFWRDAARDIDWYKPWSNVFDPDVGVYGSWFVGAECNTCYNAVDRHVGAGRGDQPALIYDSPLTSKKRLITYSELLSEVEALAAVLQEQGVRKGDRVLIYMPMVPEAAFAMLATARLGAIHSLVFGGFAATELAVRIEDCKPTVIVTASCGIEPTRLVPYTPLLEEALALAEAKPAACVVLQREESPGQLVPHRDISYRDEVARHRTIGTKVDCVPVGATDPLYILYTSGTTGEPKGVVRDNGGHMVALMWTMRSHYGVEPGEVFWAASDVGWVVGHSYIVYGPLLLGATSILYEGKPVGTPDAGAFWRVVEEHQVAALFTAPTAVRAIRRDDPQGKLVRKYNMSSLRALFLAGERADPDTVRWAQDVLSVPIVDHWWQTESGWVIAGNPLGLGLLPVKLGSPTVSMPGYRVEILNDEGHPVPAGSLGNIVIRLPLPPGCLLTLWNADKRFRASYLEEFPGFYKTSDAGYVDEDGYLYIMSRTDDIINVAGHRLSTGAMEEAIANHQDVAECAVVGVADGLKGEVPIGLIVLNSEVRRTAAEVEAEVVQLVRRQIGPVAAFKVAIIVNRLPKTRSGKILRGTMKKIADRVEWKMPATIDNPDSLEEIRSIFETRGISGNLAGPVPEN